MRPLLLTGLLPALMASVAGAQQVRARSAPLPPPVADTLLVRIRGSNPEELLAYLKDLATREDRLVTALYSSGDDAAKRKFLDELSHLTREKFTLMSVVEERCAGEAGPRPPGYMGVNLLTTLDSTTRVVRYTYVESVDPGSPAQRAGVRAGDTVVAIGGRDVRGQLPDARGLLQPGNRVPLRVARAGGEQEIVVVVGTRPGGIAPPCGELERVLRPLRVATPGRVLYRSEVRDGGVARGEGTRSVTVEVPPRTMDRPVEEARIIFFDSEHLSTPGMPYFAGAQFRTLDDEWRTALGLKADVQGVFVNAVAPGTPTAQAGLRKGDVITHVGTTPASSPAALVNMLIVTERPETTLQLLRAGKKASVLLRLPR